MSTNYGCRRLVRFLALIDLIGTLIQLGMLISAFYILYELEEINDSQRELLKWIISEDVKKNSEAMPWLLPYVLTVDTFCNVIQLFAAIALIKATSKDASPSEALSLTIFFGSVTIVVGFIFLYLLGIDRKRYTQAGFMVQLVPLLGLLIVYRYARELSQRVKTIEWVTSQRQTGTAEMSTI